MRRVEGAQRKWYRKTSVFLSRETGMPGNFVWAHQGCQVPFRPPIPNVGLLLRRCSGKGLHLVMTGEPRGFSRVTAGFSSYDGEFRMPLVLAQARDRKSTRLNSSHQLISYAVFCLKK